MARIKLDDGFGVSTRIVMRAALVKPKPARQVARAIPMRKGQAFTPANSDAAMLAAPSAVNRIEDIGAPKRDGSGRVIWQQFKFGPFEFTFKKSRAVPGILSCSGGNLPMPYHMVTRSWRAARDMAVEAATAFLEGRVPEEGVFKVV